MSAFQISFCNPSQASQIDLIFSNLIAFVSETEKNHFNQK